VLNYYNNTHTVVRQNICTTQNLLRPTAHIPFRARLLNTLIAGPFITRARECAAARSN